MTESEFVKMAVTKKQRVRQLEDERKRLRQKYIEPVEAQHHQEQSRLRSFLQSGVENGEFVVGKFYLVDGLVVRINRNEKASKEDHDVYVVLIDEVVVLS